MVTLLSPPVFKYGWPGFQTDQNNNELFLWLATWLAIWPAIFSNPKNNNELFFDFENILLARFSDSRKEYLSGF